MLRPKKYMNHSQVTRILSLVGISEDEAANELFVLARQAYMTRHRYMRPTNYQLSNSCHDELNSFFEKFEFKEGQWVWGHMNAEENEAATPPFQKKEMQFPMCWGVRVLGARYLRLLNSKKGKK